MVDKSRTNKIEGVVQSLTRCYNVDTLEKKEPSKTWEINKLPINGVVDIGYCEESDQDVIPPDKNGYMGMTRDGGQAKDLQASAILL